MAYADGNIVIGTSVDVGGINTGLKKITNSFNRLSKAASAALGIGALIKLSKSALDAASDLQEVQNIVDVSFGNMEYKVEQFAETCIEKFGMSELAAKQTAGSFMAMGKSMGLSMEEASDMSIKLTGLTGDFASFYNITQDYARTALSAVYTGETETLKRYGIVLTEANLQQYAYTQGINESVKSMDARSKALLRYQYILSVTQDMEGDFVRTQNTWANQTRVLKQRWNEFLIVLGNGLITVLTPVLQMLNTLLAAMIKFANTMGSILSKLFGIKFQSIADQVSSTGGAAADSAGAAADAEDDLADSTNKAAKAAKKALAPFDELNILQEKTSDAAASDTGAGSIDTTVDTSGIEEGEGVIKEAIDNIQDSVDSLYGLGAYIGEILENMLAKIDWEQVYQGARNFGVDLADFLNGLVSVTGLFDEVGETVAGGINTALNFLDSFGAEFNWTAFGDSLASGLNTFLTTLDWNTALSAASNWGSGIARALNRFLKNTDWTSVGSTVANALNTAIQFALDLGATFDFTQLGVSIGTSVNGFFANFNFADLAKSISTWVNGLADAIIAFMKTVDWGQVLSGIKEFFENLSPETFMILAGFLTLKTLIQSGIIVAFTDGIRNGMEMIPLSDLVFELGDKLGKKIARLNLGTFLSDAFTRAFNFVTTTIPTNIALLGTSLKAGFETLFYNLGLGNSLNASMTYAFGGVATTIAGIASIIGGVVLAVKEFFDMWSEGWSVLKTILEAIGIALAALGAVILGAPAAVAAAIAGIVFAVSQIAIAVHDNWETIKETLGKVADWIKTNIIDPVLDFFKGLWDDIKAIWETVSEWFSENVIEPIVSLFEGFKETVSTIFEGLWIIIQAVWKLVSDWFKTNVTEPVIELFKTLKEKISGFFSTLWNGIKLIWNVVSDWFKIHVTDPVTTLFSNIKDSVSGFFSDLWKDIKGVWKKVSKWFTDNVIDPVSEAFETVTDNIGEFFSTLWYAIKLGAVSAFNTVIDSIENAINWIIDGINNVISGFNSVVSWAASVIGADWGGVELVSHVKLSRIPELAKGAVIPPNNPFMALLGDQKSGTNIEAPLDTIVEAFKKVQGNQKIEIEFKGSLAELVRILKPELVKEDKRVGTVLVN